MLRLDTYGRVEGLTGTRVLKVVSPSSSDSDCYPPSACALWDPNGDATRTNIRLAEAPWGAWITFAAVSELCSWSGVRVHNLRDPDVIRPGDVIRISDHSTKIGVLYRRGANSNSLFVTEQCNSRCLMCSQPPRDEDDRWRLRELKALIPLIDKTEPQLGVTGGEPTLLNEGLCEIVEMCKEHLPDTALHVLTNGRLFADALFAARFKLVNHPRLVWGIPIYSDSPELHDYVVQAHGAFRETIKGIYNLGGYGQAVEIRVVLHKQTLPRLNQLAYFLYRNLPFVGHIALMGLEPIGFTRGNRDALWIDPCDYMDTLERATYFLANRGLPVSLYNLPLCVLPKNLWPFARRSISDWKNMFIDECTECAAQKMCSGLFASADARWRSRGIHSLTVSELTERVYLN